MSTHIDRALERIVERLQKFKAALQRALGQFGRDKDRVTCPVHLIGDLEAGISLADKPVLSEVEGGYDADARVIEPLIRAGKQVVIPPKSNRKVSRHYDKTLYKARHLIENLFEKLKQYRTIATRYSLPRRRPGTNGQPPFLAQSIWQQASYGSNDDTA